MDNTETNDLYFHIIIYKYFVFLSLLHWFSHYLPSICCTCIHVHNLFQTVLMLLRWNRVWRFPETSPWELGVKQALLTYSCSWKVAKGIFLLYTCLWLSQISLFGLSDDFFPGKHKMLNSSSFETKLCKHHGVLVRIPCLLLLLLESWSVI